jgi:creatinine amidohydrolase/Fe(II)-dependent formamide hydrolase-like protein
MTETDVVSRKACYKTKMLAVSKVMKFTYVLVAKGALNRKTFHQHIGPKCKEETSEMLHFGA